MKRHLLNLKSLVKPYIRQIVLASVFLLILTSIEMAFPAIIRQVIDIGLKGGDNRFLVMAAGLILGLGLIKALVNFREQYLTEWIAHHVAYDLRNRLYDHIQRLSFQYHDHMPTGQLISRVIEDVRSLQNFAGHGLVELARILILLIGIGILMFSRHPVLAAIAISPLIPMVLLTTDFGKRVGRLFLAVDNTLGELSSILQENVVGVQVVRAFAQEKYETDRFDQTNRKLFDRQITVVREWAKVMPSTIFLVTLGTILILWFGGQMAIRGELPSESWSPSTVTCFCSLIPLNNWPGWLMPLAKPMRVYSEPLKFSKPSRISSLLRTQSFVPPFGVRFNLKGFHSVIAKGTSQSSQTST